MADDDLTRQWPRIRLPWDSEYLWSLIWHLGAAAHWQVLGIRHAEIRSEDLENKTKDDAELDAKVGERETEPFAIGAVIFPIAAKES